MLNFYVFSAMLRTFIFIFNHIMAINHHMFFAHVKLLWPTNAQYWSLVLRKPHLHAQLLQTTIANVCSISPE